jgi:hypothetical protein
MKNLNYRPPPGGLTPPRRSATSLDDPLEPEQLSHPLETVETPEKAHSQLAAPMGLSRFPWKLERGAPRGV